MRMRYRPADLFQLRTPAMPVSDYASPNRSVSEALSDRFFQTAVGIASADLAQELKTHRPGQASSKRERRFRGSIFRYRARASLRPTPFGLFAGVAFGDVGERTSILLGAPAIRQARIRPDAGWLSELTRDLESRPAIWRDLHVIVNPSLYTENGYLWVYDGSLAGRGRGENVSLKINRPIRAVLDMALTPVSFEKLVAEVGSRFPDVPSTRVEDLLAELIKQSVLITDLLPDRSVANPLGRIADRVAVSPQLRPLAEEMLQVTERMSAAGEVTEEMPARIEELTRRQSALTPSFIDTTYQCDALLDVASPTLPRKVVDSVADAVEALCRLSSAGPPNQSLEQYRRAFHERYGGAAKVPLLELLDPYTGLGPAPGYQYPAPRRPWPTRPSADRSTVDFQCASWVMEAALAGAPELELTDERLDEIAPDPVPLNRRPMTLEAYFQIAARSAEDVDSGDCRVVLSPVGLGRAGRSFGRFADLMSEPQFDMMRALYRHEETRIPDAIFAETLYTPRNLHRASGRPGNVMMGPPMRDYQIPVNVAAAEGDAEVIRLSDLVVGVRQEELCVFSASRGVEVIATQSHMLSSFLAPNAARFLLELSTERCGRQPDLGFLDGLPLPYFPRLVRGRTVLRPAQWTLSSARMRSLLAKPADGFFDVVQEWRGQYRVPRHVYTAKYDQRLLFDLDDPDAVDEFRREIDTTHRRTEGRRTGGAGPFVIQEMTPGFDEMWVPDSRDRRYAAEFVLPLYLGQIQPEPSAITGRAPSHAGVSGERPPPHPVLSHRQRTIPPGGEWIYLKLYLAEELQDSVVAEARALADELRDRQLMDRWFFVRYGDPELHLRLRFRAVNQAGAGEVLDRSLRWGRKMIVEGLVRDQEVCTYVRELERYGGPEAVDSIESLFTADSMAASDLLRVAADLNGSRLDVKGLCAVTLNELFRRWGLTEDARRDLARARLHGWRKARVFNGDRTLIRELLSTPEDGPVSPEAAELRRRIGSIFDARSEAISATSRLLSELEQSGRLLLPVDSIASSLAHMHVNRLAGLSGAPEADVYARWHYGLKAVRGWREQQTNGRERA